MTPTTATLTRQQIVDTLHTALRALPAVHAAWLGGSDATGRTDRYSDIDCQALVDDEAVERVFTAVTTALNTLYPSPSSTASLNPPGTVTLKPSTACKTRHPGCW
mgnify:CR=1 FL=1